MHLELLHEQQTEKKNHFQSDVYSSSLQHVKHHINNIIPESFNTFVIIHYHYHYLDSWGLLMISHSLSFQPSSSSWQIRAWRSSEPFKTDCRLCTDTPILQQVLEWLEEIWLSFILAINWFYQRYRYYS